MVLHSGSFLTLSDRKPLVVHVLLKRREHPSGHDLDIAGVEIVDQLLEDIAAFGQELVGVVYGHVACRLYCTIHNCFCHQSLLPAQFHRLPSVRQSPLPSGTSGSARCPAHSRGSPPCAGGSRCKDYTACFQSAQPNGRMAFGAFYVTIIHINAYDLIRISSGSMRRILPHASPLR